MRQSSPEQQVLLYRVVAGVMAAAAILLGYALNRALTEQEQMRLHAPASPRAAGPAAPAAAETAQVTVIDLQELGQRFDHPDAEKPDELQWLYTSPSGGAVVRILSFRQLWPLHFHRLTHEVTIPILGDLEVTHYVPQNGKFVRSSNRPALQTLWYDPPYTAYSYANRSDSHIALTLALTTISDDGDHHGSAFVEPGDDRLALGSAPAPFDPASELAELHKSGQPFRLTHLPMMDGKLDSLVVRAAATVGPVAHANVLYVLGGKGALRTDADRPLVYETNAVQRHSVNADLPVEAGRLVLLPKGASLSLTAQAGAPLALVVFEPARDDVSDLVRSGHALYSQAQEELLIRDFFHDRKGGVFLDVGAGHYQHESNTFYLEERLGWSGVAVDALAEYAADYRKHRPHTRFANYLITDKAQGLQKFYRSGKEQQVSSVTKRAAEDQPGGGQVTEVEVPSITLTELLDQLKVDKIDFLSMDIEEHEPAGLAGFDIERFKPDLVCVEVHRATRDAVYAYFKKHNYVRIDKYMRYDTGNWYFTPRRQ